MGKRIIIGSAIMLGAGLGYHLWPMITIGNVTMIATALGIAGIFAGAILHQSNKKDKNTQQ
jgi:hypothetical protein